MRASATRRLRRPPAVLYGGAIAGAFNQRSSKYRRLSFYQRSICLDWARRDVQQPTINLQQLIAAESAGCAKREVQNLNADESSERLWYECGTSGLLRSSEECRGLELVA